MPTFLSHRKQCIPPFFNILPTFTCCQHPDVPRAFWPLQKHPERPPKCPQPHSRTQAGVWMVSFLLFSFKLWLSFHSAPRPILLVSVHKRASASSRVSPRRAAGPDQTAVTGPYWHPVIKTLPPVIHTMHHTDTNTDIYQYQ